MHHIYPGGKGDPLCPLGFHPQVRWPTRCKRCFRDYKEHGGKGKDEPLSGREDMTRSTPSLSMWNSNSSRGEDNKTSSTNTTGVATQNSAFNSNRLSNSSFSSNKSLSSSSSWTSTPDLGNLEEVSTTVSVTLPRRRRTSDLSNNIDSANKTAEFTVRKRTFTTDLSQIVVGSESEEKPKPRSSENSESKPKLKVTANSTDSGVKTTVKKPLGEGKKGTSGKPPGKLKKPVINEVEHDTHLNPDVEFILRVKSSNEFSNKKTNNSVKQSSLLVPSRTSSPKSRADDSNEEDEDDATSVAETDTTETTLVGKNDSELLEEVESLRNELETLKARCERVEREKSDILLRRLASFDTASTKTAASEVLKLQQKLNELSTQSEDLKDDNKSLSLRVKELEKELEEQKRTSEAVRRADELQAKLAAAETLCEELMDENEEMKKELRELEDEIEEMQDNFREDQADEYSSLKKELEQTTKNCRILSFKLRKSERKAEQLENEKLEAELKYKEISDRNGINSVDKVKKLEGDLKAANDMSARLTKELEEANKRLKTFESKNDSSKTGSMTKPATGEKVSRASLIRGGSQEDPQQLLRDLQDSLEREADLREQLRFAEEEATNLRKKAARVEEDNDSLALQLKKMATKAKTARRNSPCTSTRTPRPVVEKEETISDEEDPTELKVLLELNEQESAVLRKKVEELETDSESYKKKIKELEEKLTAAGSAKKFGGLGNSATLADKEKMKAAEQEITNLRKKIVEKDKEIKRLEGELELTYKKPRGQLVKSQSLDSPTDEKALDLKRQLELVEQEATILRTKISTLETDNEKLSAENKKLQLLRATKKSTGASTTGAEEKISALESKIADYEKQVKDLKEKLEKVETTDKKSSVTSLGKVSEVDKLKKELKGKTDELEKLTKENKVFQETLKRLREDATVDAVEFYKSRKPKKPTDLTTKLQLKKMVEDLENEIGDILVALKKSESEKSGTATSKSDVEEKNRKIKELEDKLKSQTESNSRAERVETEKKELEEEKRKLEVSLRKLEKEKESWNEDRKSLEQRLEELKEEKKKSNSDEVSALTKKLEAANKQLEEEKANVKKLKKQTENMKKLEQDKTQLEKEASERMTTMTDLKKKLTEAEDKLEKIEKNLSLSKTKVSKLEKTVQELEEAKAKKEKSCKTLEDELQEMRENNETLKSKISELESEVKKGKDTVRNLEESIRKEREKATDESLKAGSAEKKEVTALREDLSKKTKQLDELNEKCEKLEKNKKTAEESLKKAEAEMTSWKEKATGLESDLKSERKKNDEAKTSHEKETKSREAEILALKTKIKALEQTTGITSKKTAEMKAEWATKVQKLESELQAREKSYEELTGKYELLEEEHVVTKAQLVMEKEHAQSEVGILKKEVGTLEVSVRGLQESLTSKQEAWAKEKKELQERIKGSSERASKAVEAKWELERSKLQAINDEQRSVTEQLKQQNESMVEQMAHMRKENEELRKKLDDFDKVAKIQRQISADTNQLDMQLREVRGKLAAEEQNHKSEMAALKLRYESRVNLISEELQTSQNQLSRFKRERDTYKHMLEEAQVQMADLKKEGHRRNSFSDGESRDSKAMIAALEQQVSCMEDELSEARLECSKLKTEFVSEKSAWEVKLSELQSKVNELEEEKILSSGRTKVAGLRTKMELAWQKEREDQQRLLQETSTLARDLRQTLYEVERERDKERLESKRRQEQIKRTSEEEMEENRKKITELQCDLLELRDAHAKLRTTNEKLRREKEKWDRESRMLQRSRIRNEEEERKVSVLLDNIDLLLKASFEKKNSGKFLDSSKKRAKSKSRESSPMATPQEEGSAEIQLILQRLNETAEEIRAKKQEDERDEDRSSRASSVGFRRAASTESDTVLDSSKPVRRPLQRKNTLHRKSLSLSDTTGPGAQDQMIWREEENGGSFSSLDERGSSRYKSAGMRENSMDSRLSGGSTQSEVISGDKKKKKSLFGKLKKLAKSRSIEDPTSSQEDILRGGGESDSDVSTASDFRSSKKDIKEKIAGIFSKESSSRPNILEQLRKSEEKKIKTLPRKGAGGTAAPPPSAPPKSSTLGRPLDKSKNPAASLLNKP